MSGRVTSRLAATLAAALVALAPAAASAAPGSGGSGGSGGTVGDVLVAYVSYRSSGGDGGGGGGDGCSWGEIVGTIGTDGVGGGPWPREKDGVTYRLWIRRCGTVVDAFEVPDLNPADLLPQLLERLRTRSLPSPDPVFQQLDPVNDWAFVRVPIDFRAGGDSWRTVSVTAAIGPIWATVTARPTSLSFDSGDPAARTAGASCGGDAPVAAYIASQPGLCSYTYTNASSTSPFDSYHFLTTMTIGWDISWTSSSGAGGPLAGFSTSSTAPLAVAEVKGIVTCTGSRPQEGDC